jgi:hypothetical protein
MLIRGISPKMERLRIFLGCSSKGAKRSARDMSRFSTERIVEAPKQSDIVSLKFVRPNVAIVESLQTVSGFQKVLPGTSADAEGRLRTRLLQVLVKDGGEWKIAAYHNVDVKSGVEVPEPK